MGTLVHTVKEITCQQANCFVYFHRAQNSEYQEKIPHSAITYNYEFSAIFLAKPQLNYTDLDNLQHKIVNIFLPISFTICFECSKEPSH